MKGAVNQRVFDAPAGGCFLLTDAQAQLEDLFEPGKEISVYQRPEDVEEMVRRYLGDPGERARVGKAGRRRVLAEHTYERRMAKLLSIMAQTLA
jgi:spore maturation protein CgeB